MNFGLADARAALADETAPEICDPACRRRTRRTPAHATNRPLARLTLRWYGRSASGLSAVYEVHDERRAHQLERIAEVDNQFPDLDNASALT